jgi:antitoxin MazE
MKTASKTRKLTLQHWGNSLALRIPSAMARSVGFKVGQPVEISAQDFGIKVEIVGEPRLSLRQKLARFDPERHGGEAMAAMPVGKEVI